MSKLSKLYELRRLSQEFGMEWAEKQERQLEAYDGIKAYRADFYLQL